MPWKRIKHNKFVSYFTFWFRDPRLSAGYQWHIIIIQYTELIQYNRIENSIFIQIVIRCSGYRFKSGQVKLNKQNEHNEIIFT